MQFGLKVAPIRSIHNLNESEGGCTKYMAFQPSAHKG